MKTKFLLISVFLYFLCLSIGFAQYVPKDERDKKNKIETDTVSVEEETKPKVETRQRKQRVRSSEFSELTFAQKLTFSAYPGLSFGNPTVISILPLMGYRFTKNFNAGFGPSYTFISARTNVTTINDSYFGGSAYTQLVILSQYFIWAEFETTNVSFYNLNGEVVKTEWQNAPMLGAGYKQIISDRSSFNAMVLYNLGYEQGTSWRGTPLIFRVGFTF